MKKKIWFLSLFLLWGWIFFWHARGTIIFPLVSDQREDLPFEINSNIDINSLKQVPTSAECLDIENCRLEGDEIAKELFSPEWNGIRAGALDEIRNFDALIGESQEREENWDIEESNEEGQINETSNIQEHKDHLESWEEIENKIAQYTITWDDLQLLTAEDNFQEIEADHVDAIWQKFIHIIPLQRRQQLTTLNIHQDTETTAYIGSEENNSFLIKKILRPESYKVLGIDITAFQEEKFWILTLIHEFAHLFSLSDAQYWNIIFCYTGFTYECFTPTSYLNQFFLSFWKGVDKDYIEKEDLTAEEKQTFYEINKDAFLNNYASGNPHEDFAESFTAFIIRSSEELDEENIIDQKILFFYQYPELVALRREILNNLNQRSKKM